MNIASVAAIILPVGNGRLARALSFSPIARLGPTFLRYAGTIARRICNLRGGFKALRSLSFRSLVQDPQKSASIFDVLLCKNHLSLVAAHAVNLAKDQKHEEPKSRES